jgi:hypothetical protein
MKNATDLILKIIIKARGGVLGEDLESCLAREVNRERASLGFRGYGRGSKAELYWVARNHIRHAAKAFRKLGGEFVALSEALEEALAAVPPLPKK